VLGGHAELSRVLLVFLPPLERQPTSACLQVGHIEVCVAPVVQRNLFQREAFAIWKVDVGGPTGMSHA
jgi:hypothetical protein